MDSAHPLSVVRSSPSVLPFPRSPPRQSSPRRLLVFGLVLNVSLTFGARVRLLDARAARATREEALFFKALILRPGLNPSLARRIASAVEKECASTGQDPNLVLSIIAVESSFNPNVVSSAGAVGLMQVMPLWKKELGVEELSSPEVSIHAGVQILERYQQLFGDLTLALAAYNAGPGTVREALSSGTSPDPAYSEKVFALRQRLGAIDRP